MAQLLPRSDVPLEMLVLMISKKYPDLEDELQTIIQSNSLTRNEAEKEIHHAVSLYQMQLANGRIKPKALQS